LAVVFNWVWCYPEHSRSHFVIFARIVQPWRKSIVGAVVVVIWSMPKVAASVILPRAYLHRHPNNVARSHSFTNALTDVDSNGVKAVVGTDGDGRRASKWHKHAQRRACPV
jgi:hypothetical protein